MYICLKFLMNQYTGGVTLPINTYNPPLQTETPPLQTHTTPLYKQTPLGLLQC